MPQDLPPWLADRVRRNLKQKMLAAALPEDTAAKRQYKTARLEFLNEQETLLKKQIDNVLSRHVSMPDDFRNGDLSAIQYGIPEKQLAYATWSPELLRTLMQYGMTGDNDWLPDTFRYRAHKLVVRLTGLHWAVFTSDAGFFRFALSAVSSPSAVDSDGQTALHWAIKYDRRQFVEPLLAAGCDPTVRDRKGRLYTDLEKRSEIWRIGSVQDPARQRQILNDAEEVDILLSSGLTPLQYCLYVLRDFDLANRLLDKGADPGSVGIRFSPSRGPTPVPIIWRFLAISQPVPLPDSRRKADMQARFEVRILQKRPDLLEDASVSQLGLIMRQDPETCLLDYRSAVRTVQNAIRSALARLPEDVQERLQRNMERYPSSSLVPDRRSRGTKTK